MATITQYNLQKDVKGFNGYGLQFSNTRLSATLTASTDTYFAVPTTGSLGAPLNTVNKFLAIVDVYNATSQGEVWCANNATATVPADSSFVATNSDMVVQNKYYAREVKAGDVLHFITGQTATDVLVTFYALPAS